MTVSVSKVHTGTAARCRFFPRNNQLLSSTVHLSSANIPLVQNGARGCLLPAKQSIAVQYCPSVGPSPADWTSPTVLVRVRLPTVAGGQATARATTARAKLLLRSRRWKLLLELQLACLVELGITWQFIGLAIQIRSTRFRVFYFSLDVVCRWFSTCCCLSRPGGASDRQIGAHLATSTSYLIPVLDCISASGRQLPTVDFIFGSDGACVVLQNNLQPARRRGEPSTLAGLPVRTSPRSRAGSGVLPSLRTLLERLSRLDDAAQDREGEWLPPPHIFRRRPATRQPPVWLRCLLRPSPNAPSAPTLHHPATVAPCHCSRTS